VAPTSGKEVSFDVAIHSTKDDTNCGKKRHKQHPQGVTAMTKHDDSSYGKAGGSSTGCITTAAHGNKHQARPPTYHFRRLLEEVCLNHAYPIRHKLKDYDMMKSFMILGSFTRGTELDKDPSGSDTMPFPREDVVMTVHGGCLTLERYHMSKLSLGTPTCCGWGHRGIGV
jgi:hypothetical protein